jgi:hypothetical protein
MFRIVLCIHFRNKNTSQAGENGGEGGKDDDEETENIIKKSKDNRKMKINKERK